MTTPFQGNCSHAYHWPGLPAFRAGTQVWTRPSTRQLNPKPFALVWAVLRNEQVPLYSITYYMISPNCLLMSLWKKF